MGGTKRCSAAPSNAPGQSATVCCGSGRGVPASICLPSALGVGRRCPCRPNCARALLSRARRHAAVHPLRPAGRRSGASRHRRSAGSPAAAVALRLRRRSALPARHRAPALGGRDRVDGAAARPADHPRRPAGGDPLSGAACLGLFGNAAAGSDRSGAHAGRARLGCRGLAARALTPAAAAAAIDTAADRPRRPAARPGASGPGSEQPYRIVRGE